MKANRLIELLILAALAAAALFIFFPHNHQPIYVVIEVEEITSSGANVANAGGPLGGPVNLLGDYEGSYVVRTDKITALDGPAPKRIMIARFTSADEARAWYNSSEERKANEIRFGSTRSRLFFVEGD